MEILYEDNHLLVVYKPRGILAQKDISAKTDILTLAKDYLKVKYNKPGNVYLGLIHRLDINTEGIMVLAKTSKAASRLSLEMQNNNFNKEYLAIVEGRVSSGRLINKLAKNNELRKSYLAPDGKLAILDYECIKYNLGLDYSIVRIKLETGRFHQIRAQFSAIGHPLYGDVKYGSKRSTSFPNLQAYKLCFIHPVSKEEMCFIKIDNNNLFKGIDS